MRRLLLLVSVAATVALSATSATLAARTAAPPFTVQKVGAPTVARAGGAWNVSVRFSASAPGSATIVVTRGADHVQTFAFAAGTGIVTVGPFVITNPGQYRFALRVTNGQHETRALTWDICLDCGTFRPPDTDLKKIGAARVVKQANGWSVTVDFETLHGGKATIRVVQDGKTLTTFNFRPRAGRIEVGPFVVPAPGRYELILQLTDASGRTRSLTWAIVAK
jgi:hypothetical protein